MVDASAQKLPEDPETLRQMVLEQEQKLAERDRQITDLHESLRELQDQMERFKEQILEAQRARFGQSSERGAYATGDLFHTEELPRPSEAEQPADDASEQAAQQSQGDTGTKSPARRRGGGGRNPLPPELPREHRRYDYSETERAELEQQYGPLEQIGSEVTETLEYQPGKLYVLTHEVPKYASRDADGERTVITPQKSTAPVPGSQAGPSLLAHLVVSKTVDHLPANRISRQFARDGLELSRQSIVTYLLSCAELLAPIARRIMADALDSPIVHSDDTTVPQREKGRKQTLTARLWNLIGRGGPEEIIAVAYLYTTSRSQDPILELFQGFEGYLQADAFAGYLNAERQQPGLVWAGCWAHARRRFEKIARRQKQTARVHTVMRLIAALYGLERRLREQGIDDPEAIRAARQARAEPILARLRRLLERMAVAYPPKSAIGQAVQYSLNHWTGLCRYTEDGRLAMDNNLAERYMRPICVGRANWTFLGSERGGHAMAVLRTIVDTCLANGVNPLAYLVDVLGRIQDHPVNRLDQLLPYHWQDPATASA